MIAFVAPLPPALSNCRNTSLGARWPLPRSLDKGTVRQRPRLIAQLRSQPADDELILPAVDRELLETRFFDPARHTGPTTVAELRRARKLEEQRRDNGLGTDDDDELHQHIDEEDELRRRQLVDEKLSAADLFGSIAPDAPPSLSRNAPEKSTPRVQQAVQAPSKEPLDSDIRGAKSILSVSGANFLTPGAVVFHAKHGYGRFRGLERTIEENNETYGGPVRASREYVVLEYRDGELYVPLTHLDLVSVVDRKQFPRKLDLLSASTSYGVSEAARNTRMRRVRHMARVKTRAKIRQQLVNLTALYTNRLTQKRDTFPIDAEAEEKFNNACEFELTVDQRRAVNDVLDDLSKRNRPMDRLICGDVGFGKTEVAMRAAFRVLAAGKQVALLAPTTILAQQHYETFRDRFQNIFPEIKVACLTRFARRATVVAEREKIATGEMSIAIGTHMLLGDSIRFKDLGLIIVDEENRWGVNQKEKLRVRYRGVDTLVLSATPIPRTLHIALTGLKDTSVLKTPPPGRKAVITRVVPSGVGVVRGAIQAEIDRGGQVFFVVPRIEGIDQTANWLRYLFPDLRIVVAHGSTLNLERLMWAFAQYEYDVLVCTTIIENGINLPRVNTVIVQDAGRFGLATLHQLRGRVGRCDVQAYAWLLFANAAGRDQTAAKVRLATLEKNSSLGSGFVIAQKDMEMRGIGTVLGVEQHGNAPVGPEEYGRMIAEELTFARTGQPIPLSIPVVDSSEIFLPVASYIPTEYIGDSELKMMAYASMSTATSHEQLTSLASMLESKFGQLPTPTKLHISVLRVKLMAKELGITKVYSERQHVVMDWSISPETYKYMVAALPEQRVRNKFQLVEDEEKVVIRGLGLYSGDIQLAKIKECFLVFVELAKGIKEKEPTTEELKLVNLLSELR